LLRRYSVTVGMERAMVRRYWHPDEFDSLREVAEAIGFSNVASGAMVRSSYHADLQAKNYAQYV